MSASRKHLRPDELKDAAEILRKVLRVIRPEEDGRRDAMVRRRVEGAIAAAELAVGKTRLVSRMHRREIRVDRTATGSDGTTDRRQISAIVSRLRRSAFPGAHSGQSAFPIFRRSRQ